MKAIDVRRAKSPPLTVTNDMTCRHPKEEGSKEEVKETSERTTMVNGGLDVLERCCNLITGWLHSRCRCHLLVGRLHKAHDHERREWGIREAETKGELI